MVLKHGIAEADINEDVIKRGDIYFMRTNDVTTESEFSVLTGQAWSELSWNKSEDPRNIHHERRI